MPEQSATADRETVVSQIIDAPRELVFEAFTDVRHLPHWWGPEGFTTTARDPRVLPGGTTFHFVNDGIESALEQAREAAGDRDVRVAGGGATIVEYVNSRPDRRVFHRAVACAVRLRNPSVRGRGRGPRGPGAGPRGALPEGDASDLHRPGAVTAPNSARSLRAQLPADGPARPGGEDGWRYALTYWCEELALYADTVSEVLSRVPD